MRDSSAKRTASRSRRVFLGQALTTATAFAIVPRAALGGRGYLAPSERITAACIGIGAQGARVMVTSSASWKQAASRLFPTVASQATPRATPYVSA